MTAVPKTANVTASKHGDETPFPTGRRRPATTRATRAKSTIARMSRLRAFRWTTGTARQTAAPRSRRRVGHVVPTRRSPRTHRNVVAGHDAAFVSPGQSNADSFACETTDGHKQGPVGNTKTAIPSQTTRHVSNRTTTNAVSSGV